MIESATPSQHEDEALDILLDHKSTPEADILDSAPKAEMADDQIETGSAKKEMSKI